MEVDVIFVVLSWVSAAATPRRDTFVRRAAAVELECQRCALRTANTTCRYTDTSRLMSGRHYCGEANGVLTAIKVKNR